MPLWGNTVFHDVTVYPEVVFPSAICLLTLFRNLFYSTAFVLLPFWSSSEIFAMQCSEMSEISGWFKSPRNDARLNVNAASLPVSLEGENYWDARPSIATQTGLKPWVHGSFAFYIFCVCFFFFQIKWNFPISTCRSDLSRPQVTPALQPWAACPLQCFAKIKAIFLKLWQSAIAICRCFLERCEAHKSELSKNLVPREKVFHYTFAIYLYIDTAEKPL